MSDNPKHRPGAPCARCGTTVKYVSSGGCVKCTSDRNMGKLYVFQEGDVTIVKSMRAEGFSIQEIRGKIRASTATIHLLIEM